MRVLDFQYGKRHDDLKDWRGRVIQKAPFSQVALSPVFTVRHVATCTDVRAMLAKWRTDLRRHYVVLARLPHPPWGSELDEALQDLQTAGGDWYGSGGGCCEIALCHFNSGAYRDCRVNCRDQLTTPSTSLAVWTAAQAALRLNGFVVKRPPGPWRVPPMLSMPDW